MPIRHRGTSRWKCCGRLRENLSSNFIWFTFCHCLMCCDIQGILEHECMRIQTRTCKRTRTRKQKHAHPYVHPDVQADKEDQKNINSKPRNPGNLHLPLKLWSSLHSLPERRPYKKAVILIIRWAKNQTTKPKIYPSSIYRQGKQARF